MAAATTEKHVFAVDADKCRRCGMCSTECPMHLVAFEKGSVPHITSEAACIKCGHCAALCPAGALSIDGVSSADMLPARGSGVTEEMAEALVRERRSVRTFKPGPVPREALQRLLDAASPAPTGGNMRDVRFFPIVEAEEMARLKKVAVEGMVVMAQDPNINPHIKAAFSAPGAENMLLRDAPVVLLVSSVYPADAYIATTTVDLLAPVYGLGGFWNGFISMIAEHSPAVKSYFQTLGVPAGQQVCCLCLGVPKVQYHSVPKRSSAAITWH